jgi:hypothetical protein
MTGNVLLVHQAKSFTRFYPGVDSRHGTGHLLAQVLGLHVLRFST